MPETAWLACPCSRKAPFLLFRDADHLPAPRAAMTESALYMHADGRPMEPRSAVRCETCGSSPPLEGVFCSENIRRGEALPPVEGGAL